MATLSTVRRDLRPFISTRLYAMAFALSVVMVCGCSSDKKGAVTPVSGKPTFEQSERTPPVPAAAPSSAGASSFEANGIRIHIGSSKTPALETEPSALEAKTDTGAEALTTLTIDISQTLTTDAAVKLEREGETIRISLARNPSLPQKTSWNDGCFVKVQNGEVVGCHNDESCSQNCLLRTYNGYYYCVCGNQ